MAAIAFFYLIGGNILKPIIGVMPLVDEERESLWMLPGYMDGIRQAGGLPLMLPLTEDRDEVHQLVNMCDGLLFTGGHDVSPKLYHEKPMDGLVISCDKRDDMEQTALDLALREDKSVLGICRGIQFINAALGGTLYQDLDLQHPSEIEHHQKTPYDIPVHSIRLINNTPLYALLKRRELKVNSYHHQAVKELAHSLKPMAVSPDGLVEAVYKPDCKFLWAVQWHPEFSYKADAASRAIFSSFVNSAC